MIVLTGIDGTSEHDAARTIAEVLAVLWPGCKTSPAEEELIRISANTKISGYKVSDIDIVIAATLREGRAFSPKRVIRDRNGVRVAGPIAVTSFVAAIEVKDHDPSRVRIVADNIEVRYVNSGPPKWSSAVEQNIDQTHALKTYFSHQRIDLFVYRAVVMRGFEKTPCSGAVGCNFDGSAFLTALAETSPIGRAGQRWTIRSGQPEAISRAIAAPIFRTIRSSSLDRKRMDRIVTRSPQIEGYLEMLGTRMLRFRGRGGTGKTVMLLQIAWRAFDERAARSVVLTYNHALAADIRRLMALMNMPSDPEEGGIAVKTVISFVAAWLSRLGLLEQADDWFEAGYEKQCKEALDMIEGGALSRDDIEAIKLEDPASFEFDLIVADEAQDWPSPEVELIKALYAPERLCLADGVDQLMRGRAANWEINVPEVRRQIIPLKRCLRMKANLAIFANAVAEKAGVNWRVEPNREAGGGRVMLLCDTFARRKELVKILLEEGRNAGNDAVDFLFCVPPQDVTKAPDGSSSSRLGATFENLSFDIWDGTDPKRRRDFPRSTDVFRIVQYASCRGLEGWTVFLEGFDQFWLTAQRSRETDFNGSISAVFDPAIAWRQSLIPLTRAIDTLVIGLDDPASESSKVLLEVARDLPDLVEVVV